MSKIKYLLAKKIFDKYEGDYFQMKKEGKYEIYKSYGVSPDIEKNWRIEKQNSLLNILKSNNNNRIIAETFAKYGHYTIQLGDESALDFMLHYIDTNRENWDTNTLVRTISTVFSVLKIVESIDKRKEIIEKELTILRVAMKDEIIVSKDYMESGKLPEYLTNEEILLSIRRKIDYWEKALRKDNI